MRCEPQMFYASCSNPVDDSSAFMNRNDRRRCALLHLSVCPPVCLSVAFTTWNLVVVTIVLVRRHSGSAMRLLVTESVSVVARSAN